MPRSLTRYSRIVPAGLRAELEQTEGFVSIERFQSLTTENKFVSLSFWREDAVVVAASASAATPMQVLRMTARGPRRPLLAGDTQIGDDAVRA